MAKKYYPYSLIKEKLNVGDKVIISDKAAYTTQTFRIGVYEQKNWIAYTSDQTISQSDSYIKVVDLQEGTEIDPRLGNVKTIDVTFDLNVKLYKYNPSVNYAGNIKGLIRMKYKEKN